MGTHGRITNSLELISNLINDKKFNEFDVNSAYFIANNHLEKNGLNKFFNIKCETNNSFEGRLNAITCAENRIRNTRNNYKIYNFHKKINDFICFFDEKTKEDKINFINSVLGNMGETTIHNGYKKIHINRSDQIDSSVNYAVFFMIFMDLDPEINSLLFSLGFNKNSSPYLFDSSDDVIKINILERIFSKIGKEKFSLLKSSYFKNGFNENLVFDTNPTTLPYESLFSAVPCMFLLYKNCDTKSLSKFIFKLINLCNQKLESNKIKTGFIVKHLFPSLVYYSSKMDEETRGEIYSKLVDFCLNPNTAVTDQKHVFLFSLIRLVIDLEINPDSF